MRTLYSYIIRRVLAPFSLGVMVLLMALSLERLLRLVEAVNERNAPGYKVFELLFYLLPHYLGLAFPAALFLAILLAARRLLERSELAVMQSVGISLRSLYKPVFMIVVPATVFLIVLNGYAQPHARYAYRVALHELAAGNPFGGLRAGVFYELDENTVMRVGRLDSADNYMEDVFISRKKEASEEHVVIGAQRARLVQNDDTLQTTLLLENGNISREYKNASNLSLLQFSLYPLDLSRGMGEPYGPRGRDEREMDFSELLDGQTDYIAPEVDMKKTHAEFHVRIVQALSLPFLALWAIPLALMGSGRSKKAAGIVIGLGLLVFYEKLLGLGETYAANGTLHVGLALWMPWFVFGLGGWLFMMRMMPERIKSGEVRDEASKAL